MKKRNNWNVQKDNAYFEKNSGVLVTEPGQSYTVRDLVIRYQNGVPLPRVNMQYDEIFEEDVNPMRRPDFDLTDIDEAKEYVDRQSSKYIKFTSKQKSDENRLENDRKDHNHSADSTNSHSPTEE